MQVVNAAALGTLTVPTIPGLRVWCRASSYIGSDGDAVGTWTDESGNGYNLTQSVEGNKPNYKTSQINSLPAMFYDPTTNDRWFVIPDAATSGLTSAEVFLVMKKNADPAANLHTSGLWELGSASSLTVAPYTDGTILDGFATDTRKSTGNPTPSFATWRLYNVTSAAGEWTSRIDGTQFFTTATNTVGFPSANNKFLGKGLTTVAMYGYTAEFILYDHKLTPTERSVVNQHIATTYGLTIA